MVTRVQIVEWVDVRTSSRPCYRFSETGRCKYGERCRFTHQVERASPLESPGAPTQKSKQILTPHGEAGNEQCRNFKAGRCKKGDKCRFSHELQDTQGSSSSHKHKAKSTNDRKSPDEQKVGREQEIAEHEANVVIKQVVMNGSTLVTCGAGLDVQHIVCGLGDPQLHVWLLNPIQYVITIPLSQYRAQKDRWDSLTVEGADNKGAFIQVTDNGTDKACIRVLGEDKKAIGQLKVRVENLTTGETLDPKLWHKSFMGPPGQRFLKDVSVRSKAHVRCDWKSKTLKLYADGNSKQVALEIIKAEIARLESLEWLKPIDHRAIGFFTQKGIQTLKEELGEDAATLELVPTPRLKIRGGEEARQAVDRLIAEWHMGIGSEAEQGMCPICFDEVMLPVMLKCGHVYCMTCFQHFLSSAAEGKRFPLVCLGDEDRCRAPIAIAIIQRCMLQHQFDQLVEAAVTTYIEKQPTKFRYCRTADCPQVYRCQRDSKALTCPSCFATVCTGCHKEAHEGMTCREREIMDNQEGQERLNEEWARGAGAKHCPSCRVWIQKTEGCNHMSCQCGAHFCWICLATFPDGNNVNAHLHAVHGGINGDRVERARLAQEQADLVFAQRLQAEEDGAVWIGGRPQAQGVDGVLNIAEEQQRQRGEAEEAQDRERREQEERERRAAQERRDQLLQQEQQRQRREAEEAQDRERREQEERERRAAQERRDQLLQQEQQRQRREAEEAENRDREIREQEKRTRRAARERRDQHLQQWRAQERRAAEEQRAVEERGHGQERQCVIM